ncbi:MAG TPA: FkbM family methyltransferase [Burkholderiales bacterium]|nr:FkbM family methyltransferase [Burkholderiales bacterium]
MDQLIKLIANQDWLRFGIRDRIVRAYCNPDTVASTEFESDFFGLTYKGNLNSFLDWSVFFYGAYEKEYLFFLKDLLTRVQDPVFFDIGANIGHHSLFMSQHCKQVHAFEPNPVARTKLHEKVDLNSATNVFIHDVGLAEREDVLQFFLPTGANQGTGSFVAGHSSNNKAGPVLKVVKADDFVEKLDVVKIDLIKIDVEGFEKNVLLGLRNTLNRHRPKIAVEFSRTTMASFAGRKELMGLLPAGYTVQRIVYNEPRGLMFNAAQCRLVDFDFDWPECDLLLAPA